MARAQWGKILILLGAFSLFANGCLPANQVNKGAVTASASGTPSSGGKKSLADVLGGNSSGSSISSSNDGALGQCKSYAEGSSDRTICRNCYTEIINTKCSEKTYETCPDPVAKLNFTNLVNSCIQSSLAAGFVCAKTCSSGLTLNASSCTCQVPTTTVGNAGDSLIDVGAENFGPPLASLFIPNGYAIKTTGTYAACNYQMNPLHFFVKNRGDTVRSGNTVSAEFQGCKYVSAYNSGTDVSTWTSGITSTTPEIVSSVTAPTASTTYGDVYNGTFNVRSNGLGYYTLGITGAHFRGATYLFDKAFAAGAPAAGNMYEWISGLAPIGVAAARVVNNALGNLMGRFNQDGGDDALTLDPNLQFRPLLTDGATQALLKPGVYHLSFKLILFDEWYGETTDDTFNVDYELSTGGGSVVLLGSGVLGARVPYTFTTDTGQYAQTFPGSPIWNGLSKLSVVADEKKDAVYQIDLDIPITADAGITFDFYNDTIASPKTRANRSWGIKDFKFFLKSTYHPQCGIKYTFTDSNQQESKYCFRFLPRTNCDGANCVCYADPTNGGTEGSFFFPMDNQQSCP